MNTPATKRSAFSPLFQHVTKHISSKPHSKKSISLLTTSGDRREREKEMRLLTHNMLSSTIKGVTNGFPLGLEVEKVVEKQVDFNVDFIKNMFAKIEWKALVDAAKSMGYADLPDQSDSSMLDSDDFLKKFHHALLELHLEEGALICPETGRRFPVAKGIPNMLLHEDEF